MGGSSYSVSSRVERATSAGYFTKSRDETFTQTRERKAHKDMNPNGVVFRESCDSDAHPNAIPVQLYLDVTGSMGHIPHDLIKDGLPTLMGTLIQNGVPDVALMFGAIGDHECDREPLQVAQFESGDAELDMWLTRTYLEGRGGGNNGESYLLAWYFAANHIKTDAWDKRKEKGFVFTVGDEPTLEDLPMSAVKNIMGDSAITEGNMTADSLLAKAQQRNHVFHIFIEHGYRTVDDAWKQRMGDGLIVISDYKDLPKVISETIMKYNKPTAATTSPIVEVTEVEMIDGNVDSPATSTDIVDTPEEEIL